MPAMIDTAIDVIAPAPSLVMVSELPYVRETPTGLLFREDTPIEVWGGFVERLVRQHKRIEWALGDALQFGERRYGDTYAQWVEETGLAENTLATIKWVAGKIERSRRREDVGWSHHREVAALPPAEQDRLLARAADEGLTRFAVRTAARAIEEQTVGGRAVAASGERIDDPEPLVWVPQKHDLTDEARAELERRLAGVGRRHAIGYERAWLDCLLWTEQRDAFREWKNDD